MLRAGLGGGWEVAPAGVPAPEPRPLYFPVPRERGLRTFRRNCVTLPASLSGRLALYAVFRIRVHDVERDAVARRLHDAHVLAPQLARVPAAARVPDHVDFPV